VSSSLRARLTVVGMTVAMLASLMVIAAATVLALPNRHANTNKVSLCHATHSTTNPYVLITIDPAAIIKRGHDLHHNKSPNGTVLRPERTFWDLVNPSAQNDWDDIIPSFDWSYFGNPDGNSGTYPGKNWDGPKWNVDRVGAYAHLLELCFGSDEPGPEAHLDVSKTAVASFKRTHDWSIDKSVDRNSLWVPVGGSETVYYEVEVTYDGYTDSDHRVSGTITIKNDGDLDATITDIVDEIDGDPVATDCDDDLPITLPKGHTLECDYDVAYGDDGTNEVVVTATFVDVEDPVDFDADAPFTFGAPTTQVNASVDVYDTPQGGSGTKLGTLSASGFDEGDTHTFGPYPKTFNHPGVANCQDLVYNNTADVRSGTTVLDSDSESVSVNFQCGIGETATGRGLPWSATKKAPSTWFMYSEWSQISTTGVDIVAGQHHVIGRITGTRGSGANATTLVIDLNANAYFANVAHNVKIQPMSCTNNQNYVQPGAFTVKRTATANVIDQSITVSGLANTACYAIHLDVFRLEPAP